MRSSSIGRTGTRLGFTILDTYGDYARATNARLGPFANDSPSPRTFGTGLRKVACCAPTGRAALVFPRRDTQLSDVTKELSIWIEQMRSIAQTGMAFDPKSYDRERYEEIIKLAAKMAATVSGGVSLDPELADAFAARWRAEVVKGVPGYVTPKVGVGALVFNSRDEILLIKRPEGGWLFPTGWADIGYAPAQVATKEVLEETGLEVTPLKLVGIYDSARWRKDLNPHFYSIMFYCRLDGGELRPHPVETLGAGFFAREALPEPLFRTETSWIDHAWAAHHGDSPIYFDH
jgi:ADP-ribose pyrophosphatase YjhB (NUDIX family)